MTLLTSTPSKTRTPSLPVPVAQRRGCFRFRRAPPVAETTAAPVPSDHIMAVYSRAPLAFERGEGARLYTADGEVYLDCMAGIAVNALGHANPKLVAVLKAQAEKLWHVSNIFTIPGQEKLAKALTDATFA